VRQRVEQSSDSAIVETLGREHEIEALDLERRAREPMRARSGPQGDADVACPINHEARELEMTGRDDCATKPLARSSVDRFARSSPMRTTRVVHMMTTLARHAPSAGGAEGRSERYCAKTAQEP
jgi:hypothetical protein